MQAPGTTIPSTCTVCQCMETGFSSAVDLQQGLYPQHYCPLPMGKAMFLFCQVRIVQTATQIIMSFADLNTAQNHVEGKAK